MSTSIANTLIHKRVNGGTDDIILYPTTADDFVKVDSNNSNLPSGTNTLDDIVDNLGPLAFMSDVTVSYNSDTNTVTFS